MLPMPDSQTDSRIYCYSACIKYKVLAESRNEGGERGCILGTRLCRASGMILVLVIVSLK